jgi:hypothetical protein
MRVNHYCAAVDQGREARLRAGNSKAGRDKTTAFRPPSSGRECRPITRPGRALNSWTEGLVRLFLRWGTEPGKASVSIAPAPQDGVNYSPKVLRTIPELWSKAKINGQRIATNRFFPSSYNDRENC